MRLDFGNKICAGDEFCLQRGFRQRARRFQIWRGDEDDGKWGGRFHFSLLDAKALATVPNYIVPVSNCRTHPFHDLR